MLALVRDHRPLAERAAVVHVVEQPFNRRNQAVDAGLVDLPAH